MIERFENVSVLVHANIYNNGACQSRTLIFADGSKKTLGVYLPGEFVFDSHEPERVLITNGAIEVKFQTDGDWHEICAGETYDVPANCTFQVRCNQLAEYICVFLLQ